MSSHGSESIIIRLQHTGCFNFPENWYIHFLLAQVNHSMNFSYMTDGLKQLLGDIGN